LWSIRNPNGVITNSSLQNPTYTATIAGTYTATLTCTTYYNNKVYSNLKTITMVVNPKPLTPLVGAVTTIDCNNSSGSVQWFIKVGY
jgi:PKD repeat protein